MKRINRNIVILLILAAILSDNAAVSLRADGDDQTCCTGEQTTDDYPEGYLSVDSSLDLPTPSENSGEDDNIYTDSATHNYIIDFVIRLYNSVLGRDYDRYGLDYWTEKIETGDKTGSDVGYGFVFSNEYLDQRNSFDDYVEMLYNVFLGRPSDPEGKAYWISMLQKGRSHEYVFSGFVNSAEYASICELYGIERGEFSGLRSQDKNLGITGFVMRLYETILGRQYDIDGLNSWCDELLNEHQSFAQVAASFVRSQEFIELDLDDESYIKVLYEAFLDREADDYGVSYWCEKLDSGMTREEILSGFADSDEFRELIGRYSNSINGIKMPESHIGISTWAEVMADTRKLNIDCEGFRNDITELAERWTLTGRRYVFGGKVIQSGSIDCSGYVTYLYRIVLGTMSDSPESYGSSLYHQYFTGYQDISFHGLWNDYATINYPMVEGSYTIRSNNSQRFYVDKYGIGSPNLMDTREWVYYLNTVGVTSTTVSIQQLRQMPQWHFDDNRPDSFAWDWIEEYKAGDIIIWYDASGNSVHTGIYDGHGGVYHSSSFNYQVIREDNLGVQHSDLRAIGTSTPRTSLSYFIIYHMT